MSADHQERLSQILLRSRLVDEVGLRRAMAEQERFGGTLGHHLVRLRLISEEILIRALSTLHNLPAVALDPPRLNIATAKIVPREFCQQYRLICFRANATERYLEIAMADPSRREVVEQLQQATGYGVRMYIAAPSTIDQSIEHVFGGAAQAVGAQAAVGGSIVQEVPPPPATAAPPTAQGQMGYLGGQPNAPPAWGQGQPSPYAPNAAQQNFPHNQPPMGGASPAAIPSMQQIGAQPLPASEVDLGQMGTGSDDGFHITTSHNAYQDVHSAPTHGMDQRVMQLEMILHKLLQALAQKGYLSRAEVEQLLRGA